MDTTDPAPTPVASKEPEKGKNYFGLYLLVGGLKPYTMESDIETTIPLAKTGTWPKASGMTKAERIHTEYNQQLSLPCCLRCLGLFGAPP